MFSFSSLVFHGETDIVWWSVAVRDSWTLTTEPSLLVGQLAELVGKKGFLNVLACLRK